MPNLVQIYLLTQVQNNFDPLHFGLRTKFSKVSFCTFHWFRGFLRVKLKPHLSILPFLATKFKNLLCKGLGHQYNLYKSMFSIKANFLIWNYQSCNKSYKLVISMATNLVLEKIKLLKIKSISPSYILSEVHLMSSV